MRSRLLVIILLLFAVTFNYCKKNSEDTTVTFPENLIKGDSSLVVYDTVTTLKADTLGLGLKGTWSILVDSTSTGLVDNVSSPVTLFRGKLFNTYKLRWTVTNGSIEKSKDITIRFDFNAPLFPSDSVAAYDTMVNLIALAPCKSLTGRWDVLEDNSIRKSKISSPTSYTTNFIGTTGDTYKLRWTLTPRDGKTLPRYKDITVCFSGITTHDGEKYKVVKIGTQVWTAENLRFPFVSNIASMGTQYRGYEDWLGYSSRYYNGNSKYGSIYGCLYTSGSPYLIAGTTTFRNSEGHTYWYSMNYPADGWYVADYTDFNKLFNYLNANGFAGKEASALKSKLWDGTDDFGFNALPAGYSWNNYVTFPTTYSVFSPKYDEQGFSTTFWSETYRTDSVKNIVRFTTGSTTFSQTQQSIKKNVLKYYSVRLVKYTPNN